MVTTPADLATLAPWALFTGLVLLAWLAACGSPALSATAEILADARQKVFLRKLAQQVSKVGPAWLVAALLLTGLAMALCQAQAATVATALLASPALWAPPAVSLGALLVFSLLHALTWAKLKESRGLHKALGLLAALSGLGLIWLLLSASRLLTVLEPEALGSASLLSHVTMPAASPFWPLLGLAWLLALACAGGLGLAYVLMRRTRDDWGRDYYGFALRFCAGWTLLFLALQAGFLGWLSLAHVLDTLALPTDNVLLTALATTAATLLPALAAYLLVWRSAAPLRQKPLMVAGAMLLPLMLAGICLAGMKIMLP